MGVQPLGQQAKLICTDAAILDAVEQLAEKRRGKILAPDFRHRVVFRKNRVPILL